MIWIIRFADARESLQIFRESPPDGVGQRLRLRSILLQINDATDKAAAGDSASRAPISQGGPEAILLKLFESIALHDAGQSAQANRLFVDAQDVLARRAAVPLRLLATEVALVVGNDRAVADYRTARATLARLPSWGRAFRLHAAAARVDGDAARAARQAWMELRARTPAEHHAALDAQARALGIDTEDRP